MIFFLSIQCVEDEWKTMAMIRMHWRSHFLPIIADVCHWARSRKQNMIKSSFTTAKKLSTYSMYLWCLVQKLVTSFISRLVLHHTKHVCQIYYNTKTWKLCIMLGFSNHFQLFLKSFCPCEFISGFNLLYTSIFIRQLIYVALQKNVRTVCFFWNEYIYCEVCYGSKVKGFLGCNLVFY